MKTRSGRLLDKPRDMDGKNIDVISTSNITADVSPIILRKRDMVQLKFVPKIIENSKDADKCVSGKLVYEKKRTKDAEFPTEKISPKSIKVGEYMEISLSSSETYDLINGLKDIYELYNELEHAPTGNYTFTKVDRSFNNLKDIIKNEPSIANMLLQRENIDLVKILLQIITKSESTENLKESLKELEQKNVDDLNNVVNIERLKRVLIKLETNLDNSSEEDWQTIFSENQWLLSQMFSVPYTIFEGKAYIGGKSISNKGGNICDFLYKNDLSNNIAIIEIKTPCTPILGREYRQAYSLSTDMSGAINQVLNYKDSLLKEYCTLSQNYGINFQSVNPKCFLIIGTLDGLNDNQLKIIENFRNAISSVEIITFDEVVQRTKNFIEMLSAEDNSAEIED